MDRVRVEAPDRAAAEGLAEHLLGSFEAEAVSLDGAHQVVIRPDRPFDRLVADVIPALETWLAASGRDSTTFLLDGRVYTVVAPRVGG